MIWVLVGHRGSGKTKLGSQTAVVLNRPFFDLDQTIAKSTGRSPEDWIQESEKKFRELEIETLKNISQDPCIISPGGGVQDIPNEMAAIWVFREGWEKVAMRSRKRLRPEWSFEEEIQWMKDTREPRYVAWADAKFDIPADERLEVSVTRLVELIQVLEVSFGSRLIQKSWWVGDPKRIDRQLIRTKQIQAKGVEVRTDIFDREKFANLKMNPQDVLFSVRTKQERPLAHEFRFVDVDQKWARQTSVSPECNLTYSTHPNSFKPPDFDQSMDSAGDRVGDRVKWAPAPQAFEDLNDYLKWGSELRKDYKEVTILPQGQRWAWLRVIEAVQLNQWNYVSGNALPHEAGSPPWQIWALYSHATPKARIFGLIGDPVEQSPGHLFHNSFFRKKGTDAIYVKIPVPKNELEDALLILPKIGFKGLSVTAPHKREVIRCTNVETDDLAKRMNSANTLFLAENGKWLATNKDIDGMRATLHELQGKLGGRFEKVRHVLVIGKGGVSPAVLEALKEFPTLEYQHVGFRELQENPVTWDSKWDMVINSSGQSVQAPEGKKVPIWIDLRHSPLAQNGGGQMFISGDTFYRVQAIEQLKVWGMDAKM